MEDEKKELEGQDLSRKEQSKIQRIKGFVCRNRRKIMIIIGSFVAIGGAAIFFRKNPEYCERAMRNLRKPINVGSSGLTNMKGLLENDQPSLLEASKEALPEPVDVDLSQTFSARRIGKQTGKTAQEINKLLKEHGFMEGEPGFYKPTAKGEPFCVEKFDGNGYGGFAARSWSWLEWSKDVIPQLGLEDPEEYLKWVNRNRLSLGLEPFEKLD